MHVFLRYLFSSTHDRFHDELGTRSALMRLFSVRLLVCVMVVGALVFAAAATPAQRSAAALDRPPPVAQRPPAAAVWTRGYDNNRTGVNPNESLLTPTNVVSTTFGRLYTRLVDGQVYAQPLYLPNVALPDGTIRNVLFVATAKKQRVCV